MGSLANLIGLIGIVLTFFGAVSYVGYGVLEAYGTIHLVLGLGCLAAWIILRFGDLGTLLAARRTRHGTNLLVSSGLFLALLVLLNVLATRREHRFDLTEQGLFSLSPQAARVLGGLESPLRLEAFVEGGQHPPTRLLLESFQAGNASVLVEIIDPDREPARAEQAGIDNYGTVRVAHGNREVLVPDPTEESLTNAIIKVTRTEERTVCFLEGEGEPSPDDSTAPDGYGEAARALRNENFQVRSLPLLEMPSVPDACTILGIADPRRPLGPAVLKSIEAFLTRGGALVALLPPRSGEELRPLLSRWGVEIGKDIVVDEVMRLFEGPTLGLNPIVSIYGAHPITLALRERTLFAFTRSVRPGPPHNGIITATLARTSATSWAETDLAGVFRESEADLATEQGDRAGPISVAVAVSADLEELGRGLGESRLVVFGSARLANNQNLGQVYNRDLFLNAIGWLANQEDLVSIRSKSIRASRVRFTQGEATTIFYLSVLVFPEIILLVGLAVWWRRSRF